jgi:hypothetical protein
MPPYSDFSAFNTSTVTLDNFTNSKPRSRPSKSVASSLTAPSRATSRRHAVPQRLTYNHGSTKQAHETTLESKPEGIATMKRKTCHDNSEQPDSVSQKRQKVNRRNNTQSPVSVTDHGANLHLEKKTLFIPLLPPRKRDGRFTKKKSRTKTTLQQTIRTLRVLTQGRVFESKPGDDFYFDGFFEVLPSSRQVATKPRTEPSRRARPTTGPKLRVIVETAVMESIQCSGDHCTTYREYALAQPISKTHSAGPMHPLLVDLLNHYHDLVLEGFVDFIFFGTTVDSAEEAVQEALAQLESRAERDQSVALDLQKDNRRAKSHARSCEAQELFDKHEEEKSLVRHAVLPTPLDTVQEFATIDDEPCYAPLPSKVLVPTIRKIRFDDIDPHCFESDSDKKARKTASELLQLRASLAFVRTEIQRQRSRPKPKASARQQSVRTRTRTCLPAPSSGTSSESMTDEVKLRSRRDNGPLNDAFKEATVASRTRRQPEKATELIAEPLLSTNERVLRATRVMQPGFYAEGDATVELDESQIAAPPARGGRLRSTSCVMKKPVAKHATADRTELTSSETIKPAAVTSTRNTVVLKACARVRKPTDFLISQEPVRKCPRLTQLSRESTNLITMGSVVPPGKKTNEDNHSAALFACRSALSPVLPSARTAAV